MGTGARPRRWTSGWRPTRTPVHAAMMLVPEAWEKYPDVDADVKAFYEYHQCVIEPWDGPAALAFSDGLTVAAAVDSSRLFKSSPPSREIGAKVPPPCRAGARHA